MIIVRGSGGGNGVAKSADTDAENVLSGIQFVGSDGKIAEGTMPNNSLSGETPVGRLAVIKQDETYTIPKGYFDGIHTYVQGGNVATLWTNASPTGAFAAQTITLSEAATNFQKLRIAYKLRKASDVYDTLWAEWNVQVGGDQIAWYYDNKMKNSDTHEDRARYVLSMQAGSSQFVRSGYFPTTDNFTSFRFNTCYRINAQANNNDLLIPLAIYGVNRI